MAQTATDDAVRLIMMEYAEMPDLKLTLLQVQRLWNLPSEPCQGALAALTEAGYLRQTGDGCYVRPGDSHTGIRATSLVS